MIISLGDGPGDDKASRFAAGDLFMTSLFGVSRFPALPQDAEKGCNLNRGTPWRFSTDFVC